MQNHFMQESGMENFMHALGDAEMLNPTRFASWTKLFQVHLACDSESFNLALKIFILM